MRTTDAVRRTALGIDPAATVAEARLHQPHRDLGPWAEHRFEPTLSHEPHRGGSRRLPPERGMEERWNR